MSVTMKIATLWDVKPCFRPQNRHVLNLEIWKSSWLRNQRIYLPDYTISQSTNPYS